MTRDGVPSDWSAPKTFPGVFNPTVTYSYHAFSVDVGPYGYIQVIMDDPSTNRFASAYLGSYNPVAMGANYLGDAGSSGNTFSGTNPRFFQVVVAPHSTLVAVVSTTVAGAGLNEPFHLIVEGFTDSNYSEVPEPGTIALFGAGLAVLALKLRRGHAQRLLAMAVAASVLTLPALAQISSSAAQQIADILREKRSFSDGQKKMESALLFAAKTARGELAGRSYADVAPKVEIDSLGMVEVNIAANPVSTAAAYVALSGGQVLSQSDVYGTVRARMPLQAVEGLAAQRAVRSVAGKEYFQNNGTARRPAGFSPVEAFVRAVFPRVLFAGALTSQAYISHRANTVVGSMGISGAGVKVGVLSDSASAARVATLIGTGDLRPGTTVLAGQAGSGSDEGTAMMEIIQDLAPGAQLYFATAFGGQAGFAANIQALRAAGCDIIVDDVSYFAEGAFQDGTVAQAVNAVTASGALYFSSAANSGNLTLGTSGTWEGDYVNGGPVGPPIGVPADGNYHNFGAQLYDTLTATTSFISLKWSDALGASANDYDMFILNSTGTTVKGFSAAGQTGTQNPYEAVQQGTNCGTTSASGYCPAVGDRIVVVLYSGAARALRLDTHRGRLAIRTTGSVFGHNGGLNTVSMAATFWNSAKTGTKPFTGAANPIETFSSDGPRKIFYNPDGTPITPGNYLFATNGGTTLQKPDLTAADGVSTKTPGFLPFFGTSAAAPHAAAIAALVKAARPTYTNAQILNAMKASALNNMAPGWDRDGGWGVADAYYAVQYALTH